MNPKTLTLSQLKSILLGLLEESNSELYSGVHLYYGSLYNKSGQLCFTITEYTLADSPVWYEVRVYPPDKNYPEEVFFNKRLGNCINFLHSHYTATYILLETYIK